MNHSLRFLCISFCLSAFPAFAQRGSGRDLSQLPSDARAPITSLSSIAQLLASDGVENNEFGDSVAISADGSTIAVGAPRANSFAGEVYVFVKPTKGWSRVLTQTAKLTVSASGFVELGGAVALNSNGTLLAVGSTQANSTGTVYLFSPTNGSWSNGGTQIAELTPSDGISGDYLGTSVAISSDNKTVVAGAVNYSNTESDQGAVYVFAEPTPGWANENEAGRLTASDATNNQNLGISVSISGTTIAAGAWDYDLGSGGPGAVYVYTKPTNGWKDMTQTAKLTASDGAPLDILGISVSMSGNTIAAGASDHRVGSNAGQGAVYVFVEPKTGGWVNAFQTAELTASNGVADAELGYSVAISGSGAAIVAGAYCQEVGSNFCQGEMYGYQKPASGWVSGREGYDLTVKTGSPGDEFGWAVSLAITTSGPIAIGSSLGYESSTGSVYVF